KERHIVKTKLTTGNFGIDSKRGASGHIHNPFIALVGKDANEQQGEVYGFSLVYSGNHTAQVYVDDMEFSRVQLGINPFNFSWKLAPGEAFQAPEAVMVYSDAGLGKMSRTYHKLYRERLVRGKYRDIERPVLLNNWEATYFNFTEEKIIEIAKKAKSVGVELMVLDDGWFGVRNNDHSGLGDWFVNTNKLPNGIVGLAKKINDIGLKFGLWFEPEMVSPDSDLYRAHPDWCIHVPGRGRSLGRNQCILDLTRTEVRAYILSFMRKHLGEAAISYIKWDMNRSMSEPYSSSLPPEKQGEFSHRYMLGVYEILETLTTEFPDVLFEGCSGGGGRFDAGMLHYFPQYWTSDDSDAIERLYIQHGTSMVYPFSTMGAHVSAVPNHQVHRVTPIETRGDVALPGQYGFELDLNKLSDEEIETVKAQIVRYKKLGSILHRGDLYRLASPFENRHCAWGFESEDKDTIVLIQCSITGRPHSALYRITLPMAQEGATYKTEDGTVYAGDYLKNHGIQFVDSKDFVTKVIVFEKQ
ncbi:MAG: alpha-galactosidase, partial [Clostridia bacterium]|nr:alpha-galactosidase [Clostridia bacterium]